MKICVYEKLDEVKVIKYVVIMAQYNKQWVLVKHKNRDTWEFPGGHCEVNEKTIESATRELFEETGAKEFELVSAGYYSVEDNQQNKSYGELFVGKITDFDNIPDDSEMLKKEFFKQIPSNLTYPLIYPKLIEKTCAFISNN